MKYSLKGPEPAEYWESFKRRIEDVAAEHAFSVDWPMIRLSGPGGYRYLWIDHPFLRVGNDSSQRNSATYTVRKRDGGVPVLGQGDRDVDLNTLLDEIVSSLKQAEPKALGVAEAGPDPR